MGLLDDAIREHLDLKRRRGADPSEIERAEREALGPVRRGPEPAPAGEEPLYDQQPAAYNEEDAAYEFDDEPGWDEPFEEELDDRPEPRGAYSEPVGSPYSEPLAAPETAQPVQEPPLEHPPPQFESSPAPESRRFDDQFADDPLAQDAIAPPPHHAPEDAGEPAGGETVEYRIEDALEGPADSGHPREHEDVRGHSRGREDVLEETPEFLQDTPDHDRLWFEQRPPRDFDFGG